MSKPRWSISGRRRAVGQDEAAVPAPQIEYDRGLTPKQACPVHRSFGRQLLPRRFDPRPAAIAPGIGDPKFVFDFIGLRHVQGHDRSLQALTKRGQAPSQT